jgi:hypothetical protein
MLVIKSVEWDGTYFMLREPQLLTGVLPNC